MKRALSFLAFPVVILAFAAPSWAIPDQYTLDRPHTQILFSVDHLGFTKSYGKFIDYSGTFSLEPAHPETTQADVTINTGSIDLGDKAWNDELRGSHFFDVKKFPAMIFHSTGVHLTGMDKAQMTGDLTLLGVTKPVTLDVTFNKSARHPFTGKYVSGFSAHTRIARSDFGMTYGLPLVGDEVDITIEAEGNRVDRPEQGQYNR